MTATVFRDLQARHAIPAHLPRLLRAIERGEPKRPTKRDCLLFSPFTFGDQATDKGALRSDANAMHACAVVGEHDGGRVTPQQVRDALVAANIAATVYTTPSHKPDAPRWRVICPTAGDVAKADYAAMVARLNGVLGGELAAESFRPAQAFYFGSVDGVPFEAFSVDGDAIDLRPDLDDNATGAPETDRKADAKTGGEDAQRRGDAVLVGRIVTGGAGVHDALVALAARYVGRGDPADLVVAVLGAIMDGATWRTTDAARWRERRAEIPRIVESAARKFASEPCPLVWARDASSDVNVDYIVKGVLARGELAVIYGAPKSGKTFLGLDFALTVAADLPDWFGHRVRGGTVVYIAAEMGKRVMRRVRAWMDDRMGDAADRDIPFAVVPVAVNLLDEVAVLRLIDTVRAIKAQRGGPVLIVVDTLARSMTGGDENSAQDMGRALSVADRLRDEFNAATLVVHHEGKAAKGARGSSALLGAVDAMIRVDHDPTSGDRAFEVEWCRDGEAGARSGFALRLVDLGVDADGDHVATCLVDPAAAAPAGRRAAMPKSKAINAAATIALRALRDAIAEQGDPLPETSAIPPGKRGVTLDQWRDRHYAVAGVDPTDDPAEWRKRVENRRKAFERAREALLAAEVVGTVNNLWWIA